MEERVDYKELYLKMMRASEESIRIMIQAQRECEERYLSMQEEQVNSEQNSAQVTESD